MAKFKVKAWTGPTGVKDGAERLRLAGLKVSLEGTEHIYIEVEAKNELEARETVNKKLFPHTPRDVRGIYAIEVL